MTAWNPKGDNGGGMVKGVIKGPMSSVGTCATKPSVDQGMEKSLEKV